MPCLRIVSVSLAACLAACTSGSPPPAAQPPAQPSSAERKPGADRDAHGCIGSAGYAWCAATQRCERPWELAEKHGLSRSAGAFDTFCGNPAH